MSEMISLPSGPMTAFPFTVELVHRMLRSLALLISFMEVNSRLEEFLLHDKLKIKELVFIIPREQLRMLIVHYLVKCANKH